MVKHMKKSQKRDFVVVFCVVSAMFSYVGLARQADASTHQLTVEAVRIAEAREEATLHDGIVRETNILRRKAGLGDLVVDKTVQLAAQRKADAMAETGEFAHFLRNGKTPWSELEVLGFSFRAAGENLAVHFSKPDELVRAWYLSPSHRANLLNHQFAAVGIGISKGVYDGEEGYFFVQLFVTPT
jgi:uncharacterized protein YkwD